MTVAIYITSPPNSNEPSVYKGPGWYLSCEGLPFLGPFVSQEDAYKAYNPHNPQNEENKTPLVDPRTKEIND